ncbi:LysM peptidoglycan-binding domain-containing protein [Rhizobium sp. SEMIA 4085]|uniref:Peptidoglycan-binding/lysin domain-containing protein n=1 Tax=Rhizobium gallicum bv. gallicum R602sp TaxID=1041138 RepID=A0A0B4XHL3_9HYPH|nr:MULTISPECIES: LysM peptidoglycan-binding domain-containing protein [Rhizobium]AJD46078.1 peptidoglycan-binding/lysin domain-containing protein [Rhizobium gallicum bv. gallicum R602sp]NNH30500.1 LysM peptidoglycan-binding domain-containing protein [Rhizobium sp. SEMIA 4085]
MSYRIDIDGKNRYDASGGRATGVSDEQRRFFIAQINQAVRERTEQGGPKTIDPGTEKVIVVEKGDSLSQIAKENHVSLDDLMAANRIKLTANTAAIDPNDVVIVPLTSPELVAQGPVDGKGVPKGEAAFIGDLYGRGNKLAYADDPSKIDYAAEGRDMQRDVGAYLDNLPKAERQAAALRLIDSDWLDAGPAGNAVKAAIEERGLKTDGGSVIADEIYDRGNRIQYSDDPKIDYQAETGGIARDLKNHVEKLPEKERSEALQRLYDREWTDAAPARMAIEDTAKALNVSLRPSTHAGVDTEAKARTIIDLANAAGRPDEAFRKLSSSYVSATPEIQRVLVRSEDAVALIDRAADWAAKPLADYQPGKEMSDQGDAATTMANLEKLTAGTDPRLAVELVSSAMPTIEAANTRKQEKIGGDLIGMNGQADMMTIIDRIGGSPGAGAIVERFAEIGGYHPNSVPVAISNGSRLDYPIAIAAKSAAVSPDFVVKNIIPNVKQYGAGKVNQDVIAYSAHMQELQWLVSNHGRTMTPEQLAKAIEDYKKEKGPEWAKTEKRLEDNIAASGEKLLQQLTSLGNLPPELASQQQAVNDEIGKILSDEKTAMAVEIAMKKNPALLDSPAVLSLMGAQARLTDRGRKLAEEATTQIIRHKVLPSFADLQSGDPAALGKAQNSLEALKQSKLSQMLGIPKSDMDRAIDAVAKSLPEPGETVEQSRAKMTTLNDDLNNLKSSSGVRSFANTTGPGQMLRLIGIAATGASVANSATVAQNDPTLRNDLKVVIDAVGLGQRTVEILGGMDRLNTDSAAVRHFGSSGRPAVKLLGALSGGFDAWVAFDYFKAGDPLMGSLSAAAAGGTIMAALGTGTMFGPAGLVIVGAAVIGQMIVADTRDSNKYMSDTSKRFLAHSNLNEIAAGALVDQSGDGHSPVPILARYAELKGYRLDQPADRQRFIDWLNGIPKEGLEKLRDNLHHTLDEFGGDPAKLPAAGGSDESYTVAQRLNERYVSGQVYIPSLADKIRNGDAAPSSAKQIDVVLVELGIGIPVA